MSKSLALFISLLLFFNYAISETTNIVEKTNSNISNNNTTDSENITHINNIFINDDLKDKTIIELKWNHENDKIRIEKIDKSVIRVIIENATIEASWISNIDTSIFNTHIHRFNIQQKNDTVLLTFYADRNISTLYNETETSLLITINTEKSYVDNFDTRMPVSISFKNISIEDFLATMADFGGYNLVVSDKIKGNISIDLKEVPWDEIMDIAMISKDLSRKQVGDILYIAPSDEIEIQNEKEAITRKKQAESSPLELSYIRLNFAVASEIESVLKNTNFNLLSSRGSIAVDVRTNMLIISDIRQNIIKINNIVKQLDVPVDQVLIESKIVEVKKGSEFALGVGYEFSKNDSTISLLPAFTTNSDSSSGSINAALNFSQLFSGINLNLEISALESENQAKLVSKPHLLVSDNSEAYIVQGKQIAYQESSESGGTTVQFKDAVLELKVKPQIAPNGKVILTINIIKDGVTDQTTRGEPVLDKREIQTTLMIESGETVVLGGINEINKVTTKTKVPILGDIPFLGWLFSSIKETASDQQLLIFITPNIITPK